MSPPDLVSRPRPAGPARPRSGELAEAAGLYVLGIVLTAGAYLAVFLQVGAAWRQAAWDSAVNTVSLAVLGWAACLVATRLMTAPASLQVALHAVFGLAFSWAWYFAARLCFATALWVSGDPFAVWWMPPQALAWQLMQGLAAYALLISAARSHTLARERAAGEGPQDRSRTTPPEAEPVQARFSQRVLTRRGDVMAPLDFEKIVFVSGADDYSEVTSTRGRQLVRMTLAEFERRLDPARFVRVHRSTIINFERLTSAEPAGGGRLLLHLEGGHTVQASRSGTLKIRERLV